MVENIGIIGAGPAGILAAIAASGEGKKVILLEKNEKVGKKLFITGKGRCNITNNMDLEMFFDNIMTNKEFMYSSLYTFSNDSIINLLEKYKLRTKVERGGRVFPISNKSSDVIKTFEKILKEKQVDLKLNTEVKDVYKEDDIFYVVTDQGIYAFNKLIIATGGKSYPKTGSTGFGYKIAKKLGHNIIDIKPSLVPIEIKEDIASTLQGLSLKNVEISAFSGKKEIYREFGDMVFTHYGISGPIVLSMSTFLYKYIDREINFKIDLKPALDMEKLDRRVLRDFDKYNNKMIKNALDDLLPAKLREPILLLSNIDLDKFVHQITKDERERLLENLKAFPLTFKNFRPVEEAIVTSGGVDVNQIDPSTMESKILDNLYFAGEVLDVDAVTGGFNLQIAYSTGYLAGMSI